jgi:hypothetical protein
MQELYGAPPSTINIDYRSARLPLKRFINATELPFFPGNLGVSMVILLNLIFIAFLMYILATKSVIIS